jgi:hypothetical protein
MLLDGQIGAFRVKRLDRKLQPILMIMNFKIIKYEANTIKVVWKWNIAKLGRNVYVFNTLSNK